MKDNLKDSKNKGIASIAIIICVAVIAVVLVAETVAIVVLRGNKGDTSSKTETASNKDDDDEDDDKKSSQDEAEEGQSQNETDSEVESETESEPEVEEERWTPYYIKDVVIPAYEQHAREQEFDVYGFVTLIYVDDDEIPELYFDSGSEAGGGIVCTYYNGTVIEQYISGSGMHYIPKSGYIYNPSGHMGYYYDNVYRLRDGKFENVASGSYEEYYDNNGEPNPAKDKYYWQNENGEYVEVTADQYEANLAAAFDTTRAAPTSYGYNSVSEAYTALGIKEDWDTYYDVMYNLTEFSYEDGRLIVKNKDGDIDLDLKVSDYCRWHIHSVDGSVDDSSYESIHNDFVRWQEIVARDGESVGEGVDYDSPEGFGVAVENGLVVDVYEVVS